MYKVGIDIGTSLTKIICVNENNEIKYKDINEEKDVKNILDNFIENNNINKANISEIGITGVKANKEIKEYCKIPINIKNEFYCIAKGVEITTNKNQFLVANIGTGTAFVRKKNAIIEHIGGSGIGGGTLKNLCNVMYNIKSFDEIIKYAKKGNLDNIDLRIKHITTEKISNLNENTTVSNFGNYNTNSSKEDIILATINLIIETVGVMGAMALKNDTLKEIIITGTITKIPQVKASLKNVERLHNVKFIIPSNSEFITALGTIK